MDQLGIMLFGVTAVFLSQDSREGWRKWAPIFGLCSQPFWFWSAINAHQWGIFGISCLYTLSWLRGIKNNWFAKPLLPPTPTG